MWVNCTSIPHRAEVSVLFAKDGDGGGDSVAYCCAMGPEGWPGLAVDAAVTPEPACKAGETMRSGCACG